MFSFAVWVATGFTVAVIARALEPRQERTSAFVLIGTGIIAALIGGSIAAAIWPTWVGPTTSGQDRDIAAGWIASGLVSALVLWVYMRIRGRVEIPRRA
jgi:hypothetical protein